MMDVGAASVLWPPAGHIPAIVAPRSNPNLSCKHAAFGFRLQLWRTFRSKVSASNKQLPELQNTKPATDRENIPTEEMGDEGFDFGWLPAFPHALIASMSNFLFGYHIGVMNGPIVSIARELGFEGNPLIEGFVVSIFIAGAFLGSIVSGSLCDRLGFRRTFQIDTIPLILGTIICAQAQSVDEILWGRFLVGLGIGVNTVLVPVYISEVAPTKYRGSVGTLSQIGTCLGMMTALFLDIVSDNDPHGWRMLLNIASVPGLILAVGIQFSVDSPRWLCKAGRVNDSRAIIRNLWGSYDVDKVIDEFQSVIKNDAGMESRWSELLQEPHRRAAFIGSALFILQQFAGINGVLYFSSLTFKDAGIQSGSLASLLTGITNLAGALFALYLIDKQGRRKLLIGSYLGMAVSMFVVAFSLTSSMDQQFSNSLAVVGTVSYVFSFALGSGPVTGLVIPEMSSNRTRGKIMGFSLSVHWVCNFVVSLLFLEVVKEVGVAAVYGSFGGVSVMSAVFVYYYIVDTRGRSLEEIEKSLAPPPAK